MKLTTFLRLSLGLTGLLIGLTGLAHAQAPSPGQGPQLHLPVTCEPGATCWIPNFVDLDSGPGIQDYTCGPNSYNAHKGTDFAISNLKIMRKGVDVLAAAKGVVKSTRDGMPDVVYRWLDPKKLKGRECGNGIVIDHGNGWESQYCHLLEGSIAVKTGQWVSPGDTLGLIGLSGQTIFPHLHFELRHNKKTVDPFNSAGGQCGVRGASLWAPDVRQKLSYRPSAIYNIGFTSEKPIPQKARLGLYDTDTIAGPANILFVTMEMFGAEPNDQVIVRLSTTAGRVITQRRVSLKLDQRKARIFHGTGFRQKNRPWPPGTFKADVEVLRKGAAGAWSFKGSRTVTIK